jgi:hypothetical protein
MGRRRLPCDLHFSLRFEGEPVSTSKLTCFLGGSGDRVETVARRGLGGVDAARKSVTRQASSEGMAGRVLLTLGGPTFTEADVDEALWSLKISPVVKTFRGRRLGRVG